MDVLITKATQSIYHSLILPSEHCFHIYTHVTKNFICANVINNFIYTHVTNNFNYTNVTNNFIYANVMNISFTKM